MKGSSVAPFPKRVMTQKVRTTAILETLIRELKGSYSRFLAIQEHTSTKTSNCVHVHTSARTHTIYQTKETKQVITARHGPSTGEV